MSDETTAKPKKYERGARLTIDMEPGERELLREAAWQRKTTMRGLIMELLQQEVFSKQG